MNVLQFSTEDSACAPEIGTSLSTIQLVRRSVAGPHASLVTSRSHELSSNPRLVEPLLSSAIVHSQNSDKSVSMNGNNFGTPGSLLSFDRDYL